MTGRMPTLPQLFALLAAVASTDTGTAAVDATADVVVGADTGVSAGTSSATTTTALEARLAALEAEQQALRAALEALTSAPPAAPEAGVLDGIHLRLSGYLDFGFFRVGGDGAGTRADLGNTLFPEYAGQVAGAWVFYGDPLSTAINTRGEPASTGDSRAVTLDAIDNGGAPSFIVSSLGLGLLVTLGESLTLSALVDLVPRSRDVSSSDGIFLGDHVDVKLAYAQYDWAFESVELSLAAGKVDSLLGREYRGQDADTRLGVTPSLICRYTCGRPLGLRARLVGVDVPFTAALGVANGSSGVELFPLSSELDDNAVKTVSGRLSYTLPLADGLELGASGMVGAQDLQTDDGTVHWQVGADLHWAWGDLELAGELVKGRADGRTSPGGVACDEAQCLEYLGAYGWVAYRLFHWLTPYTRLDGRSALHRHGASFVYVSELLRATVGLRSELGEHVIVKAEYTFVRELGEVPDIDDDVLTSSLVVRY
jgi:hypothetical protein